MFKTAFASHGCLCSFLLQCNDLFNVTRFWFFRNMQCVIISHYDYVLHKVRYMKYPLCRRSGWPITGSTWEFLAPSSSLVWLLTGEGSPSTTRTTSMLVLPSREARQQDRLQGRLDSWPTMRSVNSRPASTIILLVFLNWESGGNC